MQGYLHSRPMAKPQLEALLLLEETLDLSTATL
jgi:hypothetical protein